MYVQIKNHAAAWPFQKPVDKDEVPDYYDHIKYPMGESVVCHHVDYVSIDLLTKNFSL